jgi:hypothetical protein
MSAVTRDSPGAATPPPRPAYAEIDPRDQISRSRFPFLVGSLAFALGAVCIVLQRVGSQFYADDYLFLQLARNNELSLDWVTTDNYGHFAPLTRLAYFAVQRGIGFDYTLSAVVPATLVAVLFLTLCWLFHELLGRRYVVLALALLATTSVPLVRTMLWWGAAVHVLGAATMMTLCVTAFVVWSRRGLERYRVISVMALVVGLLVQERPLLTIGYLVLIRYLLGVGWKSGRPLGRMLREEALVWLPYVVVDVVYLVYRIFFFPSSPQPGDPGQSVDFIALSTVRGYAPTLIGQRVLPGEGLFGLTVAIGLVVFVVLALVLVTTRRGGWRALVFLVLVYLANMGILAAGRFNVADLRALATDLQYYVDVHIATVVAFVFGFVLMPKRTPLPSRRRRGPVVRYGLPVAVAALALSTAGTARAIVLGNNATVANGYVYRAQAQLRAEPGPYALMRTKVPVSVAPSFTDPYTDVPAIFSLDPSIASKLDPASPTRLVVTHTGAVEPVHGQTVMDIPITSNRVSADLGELEMHPGTACLSGDAGSYFKLKLPRPVDGSGLFVAITYSSPEDAEVLISTRGDPPAYNWSPTELPSGQDQTVVDRIDGTQVRSLILASTGPVSDLCLSAVEIGRLAAQMDGECYTLSEYGEPLERADVCGRPWPDTATD